MAVTVTQVARSSVLLGFGGQPNHTDRWFSEESGYYRGEPLVLTPDRLPARAMPIYDLAAIATYPDKAVPFDGEAGTGDAARRAGFTNVAELEP